MYHFSSVTPTGIPGEKMEKLYDGRVYYTASSNSLPSNLSSKIRVTWMGFGLPTKVIQPGTAGK